MAEICLPGTGGMMPLKNRWLATCHVSHKGMNFLIDCGEGTQIALEHSGLKPNRIDVILLTHFHSDHIMGLPGLLMTMANKGKLSELLIIGPKRTAYVISALCVVTPKLPFEVRIIESSGGDTIDIKNDIHIVTMALKHRTDCLGYSMIFDKKPVFSKEKAQALNIPLKYYSLLHNGRSVEYNGRVISPDMVIERKREPLKITYATDTLPIPEIADFASNSDLFICESMYADDSMANKMAEKNHMTMRECAGLANKAHVKKLITTHFSPAFYPDEKSIEFLNELFDNAEMGYDGLKTEVK